MLIIYALEMTITEVDAVSLDLRLMATRHNTHCMILKFSAFSANTEIYHLISQYDGNEVFVSRSVHGRLIRGIIRLYAGTTFR